MAGASEDIKGTAKALIRNAEPAHVEVLNSLKENTKSEKIAIRLVLFEDKLL